MAYDNVAKLPFLLDSSDLTPEEAAERRADPALFAAKRYGQPEHYFRAAAKRHGKLSSTVTNPAPPAANSRAPAVSAEPSRRFQQDLGQSTVIPTPPHGLQPSQSSAVQRPSCSSSQSAALSSSGSEDFTASAAYFSTVLLSDKSSSATAADVPSSLYATRKSSSSPHCSNGAIIK